MYLDDPTLALSYRAPWGHVDRPLQDMAHDEISLKEFGLYSNHSGLDNAEALRRAISFARAALGVTFKIPRGVFDVEGEIDTTDAQNMRIKGDSVRSSILRVTSPSANLFSTTWNTYGTLYRDFEDFTITSAVPRTGGAYFDFQFERMSRFHRLRLEGHFHGIVLRGFEQTTLNEVHVCAPSGPGYSLQAGIHSTVNQGANLNVVNCFFRGNNNWVGDDPIGLAGVVAHDVEALFFMNTDIGSFKNQALIFDPQTRIANCYFVNTYFDGTKLGDNVLAMGPGMKQQMQFTGCWFNGAGKLPGGFSDCMGFNASDNGSYFDWNFTGCRFVSQAGSGVYIATPQMDFNFDGCTFVNTGSVSTTYRHAIHFNPARPATAHAQVTGSRFSGSAGFDIRVEAKANLAVNVSSNTLTKGVSLAPGAMLAACAGNNDQTTKAHLTAASAMPVPPTCGYYFVVGGTTINFISPTSPGHQIALRFAQALTVKDDGGNLRLGSDFVTQTNSMLELVCEANGDWRELNRKNT